MEEGKDADGHLIVTYTLLSYPSRLSVLPREIPQ